MSESNASRSNRPKKTNNAFTLLETLLAVVIATGLLSTAMYFYQQSGKFRNDLILENESIASARLILNKMSSELRSTLTHPRLMVGLKGGSNWVEFLKTETPSKGSWMSSTETQSPSYPETGYRLIRYQLAMKRPGIPMDRIAMLKRNYEEKLAFAMEEDRERASLFIKPKLGYI